MTPDNQKRDVVLIFWNVFFFSLLYFLSLFLILGISGGLRIRNEK